MSDKLLIMIATGEKKKALAGLLYAVNAIKHKWIPEVRVIFFGPSEALLVEDDDVQVWAEKLKEYQVPLACKFISDRDGVSDALEGLGIDVEFVGTMVSDLIKEGYTPMVF